MTELALGTVQFGLAYGVAGRAEPIPPQEAREILARAWALGIRRLDTAPGYGDVEERLAALAGDLPFSIVSKVPPLPKDADEAGARAHVRHSVRQSRARLGERLAGLLFHAPDDLEGPWAEAAWQEAGEAFGPTLGPSCYDAGALAAIARRFPIRMAQLPGSALDQSVAILPSLPNVELTLRSVFLQGLLLMPPDEGAARVPAARAALARWHAFCAERGMMPLRAALAVAKGLPAATYCVVGVDTLAQLEEVAAQWAEAGPAAAPSLDADDAEVTDPRRWP